MRNIVISGKYNDKTATAMEGKKLVELMEGNLVVTNCNCLSIADIGKIGFAGVFNPATSIFTYINFETKEMNRNTAFFEIAEMISNGQKVVIRSGNEEILIKFATAVYVQLNSKGYERYVAQFWAKAASDSYEQFVISVKEKIADLNQTAQPKKVVLGHVISMLDGRLIYTNFDRQRGHAIAELTEDQRKRIVTVNHSFDCLHCATRELNQGNVVVVTGSVNASALHMLMQIYSLHTKKSEQESWYAVTDAANTSDIISGLLHTDSTLVIIEIIKRRLLTGLEQLWIETNVTSIHSSQLPVKVVDQITSDAAPIKIIASDKVEAAARVETSNIAPTKVETSNVATTKTETSNIAPTKEVSSKAETTNKTEEKAPRQTNDESRTTINVTFVAQSEYFNLRYYRNLDAAFAAIDALTGDIMACLFMVEECIVVQNNVLHIFNIKGLRHCIGEITSVIHNKGTKKVVLTKDEKRYDDTIVMDDISKITHNKDTNALLNGILRYYHNLDQPIKTAVAQYAGLSNMVNITNAVIVVKLYLAARILGL